MHERIVPQTRRICIVTATSRSDFELTSLTSRSHVVAAQYNTGRAQFRSLKQAVEFVREAADRRERKAAADQAALAHTRDGQMMAQYHQPTPLRAWKAAFNAWLATRA